MKSNQFELSKNKNKMLLNQIINNNNNNSYNNTNQLQNLSSQK